VRPPVTYQYEPFNRRDLFIDLRNANAAYTIDNRDDFILDDLAVPIGDLVGIFVDSLTRLLCLTVRTPEVAAALIARLQDGVPWTACGGVRVYGWHPTHAAVAVRLTDVPTDVSLDMLREHMKQFGHVLSIHRSVDRTAGRIGRLGLTGGVVHLSMVPTSPTALPSYVDVETVDGSVPYRFSVYSDLHRRRCYRCGTTGHIGQFCRASARAREAPRTLWSVLRVPEYRRPAPTGGVAQRPPLPQPMAEAASSSSPTPSRPGPSLPEAQRAPRVPPGMVPPGGWRLGGCRCNRRRGLPLLSSFLGPLSLRPSWRHGFPRGMVPPGGGV